MVTNQNCVVNEVLCMMCGVLHVDNGLTVRLASLKTNTYDMMEQ